MVAASLVRTDQGETVRIIFASYKVEIVGRNLRDLLLALQDFAVKWIRVTPPRYQSLVDREGNMISKIAVEAIE